MDVGMLWFDNDTHTDLPSKIDNAAEYYLNKYGIQPNVCFVHPSMTPEEVKVAIGENGKKAPKPKIIFTSGNIEVRTSKSMLPNHLWIGINGSKQ